MNEHFEKLLKTALDHNQSIYTFLTLVLSSFNTARTLSPWCKLEWETLDRIREVEYINPFPRFYLISNPLLQLETPRGLGEVFLLVSFCFLFLLYSVDNQYYHLKFVFSFTIQMFVVRKRFRVDAFIYSTQGWVNCSFPHNISLIIQQNPMMRVRKRIVSVRRFFWVATA